MTTKPTPAVQPKPQRVEVTLKKAHRHSGEDKKPGDKIRVWPRQRDRLKEVGVI